MRFVQADDCLARLVNELSPRALVVMQLKSKPFQCCFQLIPLDAGGRWIRCQAFEYFFVLGDEGFAESLLL